LVQFFGTSVEGSHKFLVFEFMSLGSLERFLTHSKQRTPLNDRLRARLAEDVLVGLQFLHDHQIVHRDLATRRAACL
jgi:serine/threonine protein kinase